MMTFLQFLTEWPVSDLRYFKDLPDVSPDVPLDEELEDAVNRYHFGGMLHWKVIHNKSFTHSREMDDGIIGLLPNETLEVRYHELAHEIWDHCDKEAIKPLLDRIRNTYGKIRGEGFKWMMVGGYSYSYSHSGKEFEYDELFAISFAYVEGDKGKFEDPDIDKDFREVLQKLQNEPLFNVDPYSDHDSVDKI